jgi:hypothetical protein
MIGEPSIVMSSRPPQVRRMRRRPITGISAMPPSQTSSITGRLPRWA